MEKECRTCNHYDRQENECNNPDSPRYLDDMPPSGSCGEHWEREEWKHESDIING